MLDYLKRLISFHSRHNIHTAELLELCELACSKDKTTPPFSILHHAVRGGDADFVEVLLNIGKGFVGLQDNKGKTDLHYAAKTGDTRLVRALVERGQSDIFAHSKRGDLPICLAIRGGHLPVVEYMLDHSRRTRKSYFDKKPRYSFMTDAVAHPEILRVLAQHCCAIEGHPVATSQLIFDVAMSGKAGAVGVLIEAGLDIVDLQDNKGETALHYAAKMGDTRVVRQLVERGKSDVITHSKRGDLPICLAIRGGHLPVVEYMLDHSRRTKKSYFDKKPPHCCAIEGHPVATSELER
ncbi:similar to ankyrin 2,3/unc44 [Ectocarpus siliculosus]|uniref:Similar to ankyrin 2,3/unc44 n=1 Tax=Ectocarpus siliculosus TaxID=2880 RepID=D7G7G2_ECTSI|nr:similar to ankyrin 2,3/unc44 [Ectocarpus siliculosus]|eukprot:CBJ27704.1 similar to ankyrin 2,3/unc44 [Ectocarpus siliculosus]